MVAKSLGRSTEHMSGAELLISVELAVGSASIGAECATTNLTKGSTKLLNPFSEMLNSMDLYGWVTGSLGKEETGFCTAGLYGHLCAVNSEEFDNEKVRARMTNILMKHLPPGATIFSFNDSIAKDDADVRELLKHCAQDWDAQYGSEDGSGNSGTDVSGIQSPVSESH